MFHPLLLTIPTVSVEGVGSPFYPLLLLMRVSFAIGCIIATVGLWWVVWNDHRSGRATSRLLWPFLTLFTSLAFTGTFRLLSAVDTILDRVVWQWVLSSPSVLAQAIAIGAAGLSFVWLICEVIAGRTKKSLFAPVISRIMIATYLVTFLTIAIANARH